MKRVCILVGLLLPILLATTVLANDFVITQPLVIPPNTVMTVSPTDHYAFSGAGQIVVSSNATLQFLGRTEHNLPSDVALFTSDGSMAQDWPIIDVQNGGQVIGKHAQFTGLPVAIRANYGKVVLDSVGFLYCYSSLYVQMFRDTIALTNSTITGGYVGVSAISDMSPTHYFLMQNCVIELCTDTGIELFKMSHGLIDHCKGQGVDGAIGIFLQGVVSLDILYYSGWDWSGNIEWLDSSPHLAYDSLAHSGSFGICASGDYIGAPYARIDHCYIGHNGWEQGVGGVITYACSPIFSCNSFDRNVPYQVYATGNSAPSFYDAKNGKTGSNEFHGTPGSTLVYIQDAYPYFLDGQNEFALDDGVGHYMQNGSMAPKAAKLNKNHFVNGIDISFFLPSATNLWSIGAQSAGAACGESIGDYRTDVGGKVLYGDALLAADLNDSAAVKYTESIDECGVDADAGAVAFERLSQINTNLPVVTTADMTTAKEFLLSYKYDASANFTTSDSIRTVILATGNSTDSARVAYDAAVALLLQNTSSKANVQTIVGQQLQVHQRRDLFNHILTQNKINAKLSSYSTKLPETIRLLPVYPNPFNATTQIRFDVASASRIKLAVYNADGRLVKLLSDANYEVGSYRVEWNGRNNAGSTVASGVYFIKMQSPNGILTKKAILLK